jgi:hypothetical protein
MKFLTNLPFSPKTRNIIILILGVLLLAALFYYSCSNREGFDGTVPQATQTSAIPSDTPGATTTNPTIAKPQTKDIQAALDEADAFFILAATFDYQASGLPVNTRYQIATYRMMIDSLQKDLKEALAKPESSNLTLQEVNDLRKTFTELAQTIRSYTAAPTPPIGNQPKMTTADAQALQTAIQDFIETLKKADLETLKTSLNTDMQVKIGYAMNKVPEYMSEVSAVIKNPEAATIISEDAQYLLSEFKAMKGQVANTPKQQQIPESPKTYETTVVAGKPGVITLKELNTLVSRIDEEHLRLANLRSSSATLLTRQTQLEKLAADIRELIGAVERKEMKLEDVPIQPSSAEAFLKQFEGTNTPIPPLIEPRATIANGLQAHITPSPSAGINTEALHGLLENAKFLKWNLQVKLEYDPKLAARDNVLKRLEQMERRLTSLAMSETPIPKEMYDIFVKELQVLNTLLSNHDDDDSSKKSSDKRVPTTYTRGDGSTAEYPSADTLRNVANLRDSASGNAVLNTPKVSPDVFIRPGFIMNDAAIQRRASASAFDDSLVGGPDYKKRAQDLCRQVQGANLGDPVQFGCITNPDSVGQEYSWKGNYQMVCNRIGDTWGGWYPEMFGCPKYDPTQKFKGTMM